MYANNEIGSILPIGGDRRGLPGKGRAVPHGCGAGGGASAHRRRSAAYRYAEPVRPQIPWAPRASARCIVRKGVPLTPLINGGAQERGKRAGTENLAGIAGHGGGAGRRLRPSWTRTPPRLPRMRDRLIAGLVQDSPCGAERRSRCTGCRGMFSFCFEGIEGESLLLLLDARRASAPPPVQRARRGLWSRAMCCWLMGHTHDDRPRVAAADPVRVRIQMEQIDTIVAAM